MLVATSLFAQLLLAALDQGIVQQFGQPELLRAIHRPDWVSATPEIDSNWVASAAAVVILGSPGSAGHGGAPGGPRCSSA